MKKLRILSFAVAALLALASLSEVVAQTRPTSNPTYIPTGQMAAQTLTTATSSSSYVVNGEGTVAVLVTGTHPGLVATIQGSNNPSSVADASATWFTLQGVTANGLYRVPAGGLTRIRFTVSAITSGSVIVTMAGSPGPQLMGNMSLGAIITNSLATAGDVTSTQFINHDGKGITCTYNQTAESGSPNVTFKIQAYDAASNAYHDILSSGTIVPATDGTSTKHLTVYPGILASALPTNYTGINLHMPRAWRVVQTVSGTSGPAVTGTVGCDVLQ